MVSVLDGSEKEEEVSHSWRREHAKLYVDAGVVKKGEEENVDVVQEQQLPVGDGAAFAFMIALMIFGKYACGIGHTYETNKTAKALQREVMKNLDVNALVLQASTATATKETTEEAVPMKVEMAKKDEATMKEVLTMEEEEAEAEAEAEAVPMSTSTSSMSKMTKGFESSLLRKACESAMEIMGDPDAPLIKTLILHWVDICPISSTTTNAAVFDESIIGEVLGQNKSLQDEYFGRSREALLSLTKNAMFVSMNKYPICYPAGEAVDENAIEKWLKLGYLRIKETIYEEQPYKVQLVEVNVSDNDEEKWQMTLFVRGGHHPSAHLRPEPSIVEDFKITCGLLAASICFVNVGNKKFFKECLSVASERRLEVVKKRRVMFQELLKKYHEKLLREAYEPNQNLLLLYKREFVHLRHIELEVKEVAENFEWFLKENDSDSVLKHLKLESFVKGLGRSESSTKFRKSLTTLKGNPELLKKIENALSSNSFYAALAEKGDAYLDALAKARKSGAFKGIDAAYANFMGSNSFLSAYAKKGDAFLKEREGVKAAQIFARNPDAIERAQKKGSYNAAVNKLGGDKLRERLDKLVLPSNAFGGNEELLNKGMGVNGFHSAIANADENAVRSFLAELNSAKKKLTMNGDASLFEVAMTNGSFHACISNKNGCDDFINLLGRMITSQAFVDNPQARKSAIRGSPVLRALFERGEGFLTALVEVQQKSYRNKKAFAVQLGRVDKKHGTTCREFVDEILNSLA